MLKKLIAFVKRRSAAQESDTEYNGAFSYAGEFHSAIVGLSVGLTAGFTQAPEVAVALLAATLGVKGAGKLSERIKSNVAVQEIRREPWYCAGSVIVGYGVAYVPGLV